MAKKRKASRAPAEPTGPKEYDTRDARLGPVTTFEDIADEQEQYFLDRDQIDLDDEPGTKRRRRQQEEDEFLELSDASVLGDEDADDSDNEDFGERRVKKKSSSSSSSSKKGKAGKASQKKKDDDDDDADDDNDEDAEGDQGWWGSSKAEYYDGENIETEANALEEEQEARRLQKAQLGRMTAADFFDASEWAEGGEKEELSSGAAAAAAAGGSTVTTITVKTAEAVGAMTPEEQRQQLRLLYPEFDHVCDEFAALEPQLSAAAKAAAGRPATSLEVVRYRVLACYLSTMALYFALLTAPARDRAVGANGTTDGTSKAEATSVPLTDPADLHDHEVMASLVDCREAWAWVERVRERRAAAAEDEDEDEAISSADLAAAKAFVDSMRSGKKKTKNDRLGLLEAVSERSEASDAEGHVPLKKAKKTKKTDNKATKEKKKKKPAAAVPKEVEASLAELSDLLKKKPAKTSAKAKTKKTTTASEDDEDDDQSDFGEEEALDARTAEEKLKRKKTLGFYTSQIMQKANLRAGGPTGTAGNGGGGGDMDIPYRERLRDRQARLNAAAVRRGQQADANELGGSDGEGEDEDEHENAGTDDADLAYYNSIVRKHAQKQDVKQARKADEAAARLQRVEPASAADADGRRQLSWEIAKNKGLSHRTLKEKKNNPRVKKRLKFEKKKKQLASMRPVYKAVDRNNYQGERTGIKTDVVRGIRL